MGRLLKPHGLAGEMVVQLLSDRTERVAKGSVLYHEGGALTVRSSRPHQDRYLVRFDEVSSREQCDALRGRTLTAPPLDDADGYWVHELVGATVVTADGVERGVVESVQANPANDLLVLDAVTVPAAHGTATCALNACSYQADADYIGSDCPMAGHHIAQGSISFPAQTFEAAFLAKEKPKLDSLQR